MSESAMNIEQIHADFRPKVQRYLARMVGEHEAEDLTQEVFVKIHRALPTFRGDSQLSTWIYRIAANAALDRLRAPSFQRIMQDEVADASGQDAAEDDTLNPAIGEQSPSPEQQVCDKERYDCYRAFIADLPSNYRAVVALSELEELAAQEIAEILGLSVDVVKIRLHRGRLKLLEALKTHCKAEDWL